MDEPIFLGIDEVLAFHEQQLELFGGEPGIGDRGLLESAIAQPQTTWFYDPTADLFDLAAAYAFHLAKNHAFNDGNKRTALEAALAFLEVNASGVVTSQEQMFAAMIRLTTSEWSKKEFAAFLRDSRLAL